MRSYIRLWEKDGEMAMSDGMNGGWEQERKAREAGEAEETVELRAEAGDGKERRCDGAEDERAVALAILLGQMVAYLSGKVDVDDLDIVSFSLHHLFCNLDSLYRLLLPSFAAALAAESERATDADGERLPPRIRVGLQDVLLAARQMLPLCRLLSEAGESTLGQLGYGRHIPGTWEDGKHEEGRTDAAGRPDEAFADEQLARVEAQEDRERAAESERDILYGAVSEGVEQALHDLAAMLICWQQRYRNLPSFRSLLYTLFPTTPLSLQPDTLFTQLLAYGCTLFGDIVPAFHALSPGDEEAVIMLLFDLLQQVDLLAVQCETLLQLFTMLGSHDLLATR